MKLFKNVKLITEQETQLCHAAFAMNSEKPQFEAQDYPTADMFSEKKSVNKCVLIVRINS